MKASFVLLIFFSLPLWARSSECYKQSSQADKNECMAFERDKAIGSLVNEVTEKCAQKPQMQEEKGSSQPMVLDECMSKEFKKLEKKVK